MGDATRVAENAPLAGCMGSYKPGSLDPSDLESSIADDDQDTATPGDETSKSLLTMEYQAIAAREGWAHFYAAWLFNAQNEFMNAGAGIAACDLALVIVAAIRPQR